MRLTLILFAIILINGCISDKSEKTTVKKSLKSAYSDDFLIGAALNLSQINEEDNKTIELLKREFNSITSENIMKSMYIHPKEKVFFFDDADKFVALGEANDMYIMGHTLIWHSQLSPWFEEIADKEEFAAAVKEHINTIVGKYKGRIDGWDVVNEALNEDGTLRESIFLNMMGNDYLSKAFALAAKADPQAELYYNDYNLCMADKRKGAIQMIKKIQANGVKIDGIGLQGHWSLDNGPTIGEIEKSIIEYSKLGIKVAFTEVDITVIPSPWDLEGADVNQNFEGSPFMNPYPKSLPDSVQTKLAQRYEDIFNLFLKHKDKISRVTFWGVNDQQSWLNNWPIKGRTNYPLLFDRKNQPKPAYDAVMKLKNKKVVSSN